MKTDWITSSPVGNILEVSPKTVERLSNSGQLPFRLVDVGGGRTIKIFDRNEILAFKAKKETTKNKSATTAAPLLVA